jgi:hypothetical protein
VFEGGGGIRLEIDAEAGDGPERWQFCVLNHGGDHAELRIALLVESSGAPELEVWEMRPMLAEPRREEIGDVKWHSARSG